MHRCLLIPEIARLICSELRNVGARKSLAALAQTCLAISEPALDSLWYEIHDIIPLVKCMPPDLWRLDIDGERKKLVNLFSSSSCTLADDV